MAILEHQAPSLHPCVLVAEVAHVVLLGLLTPWPQSAVAVAPCPALGPPARVEGCKVVVEHQQPPLGRTGRRAARRERECQHEARAHRRRKVQVRVAFGRRFLSFYRIRADFRNPGDPRLVGLRPHRQTTST